MIKPFGALSLRFNCFFRWLYGHREPVAHKLRAFLLYQQVSRKGRNVLRLVQYNSEDIATGTSSPEPHNSTLQSSDPHPGYPPCISQRPGESRFSGQVLFRLSIVQENSTNFIETLFKIFFRIFWGKVICFFKYCIEAAFYVFFSTASFFCTFLFSLTADFCTSCGFSFTTGFSGMTRTRRFDHNHGFFGCILASIIAVILTNYTIFSS